MILRPLKPEDVTEHADLLYVSFNYWYWKHGWGRDYFTCKPHDTAIFYQIYNDLSPGCSIAAFEPESGRMMGSCFYHPREHHVSLGIMSIHPNYIGKGVGRALVNHITDFTDDNGYKACRIASSAINMDSFSLYNRSGFVPRVVHQDMVITVPKTGLAAPPWQGQERVREATVADVEAMGALEMAMSNIRREKDYRYAIENPRLVLHATVYENDRQGLDGFMISVKHPALNMLGPCVARSEEVALALIGNELERFRGTWALFVVPMQSRIMVEELYRWGAVNVETHLLSVRGDFQECLGVNMPSFLPETG